MIKNIYIKTFYGLTFSLALDLLPIDLWTCPFVLTLLRYVDMTDVPERTSKDLVVNTFVVVRDNIKRAITFRSADSMDTKSQRSAYDFRKERKMKYCSKQDSSSDLTKVEVKKYWEEPNPVPDWKKGDTPSMRRTWRSIMHIGPLFLFLFFLFHALRTRTRGSQLLEPSRSY